MQGGQLNSFFIRTDDKRDGDKSAKRVHDGGLGNFPHHARLDERRGSSACHLGSDGMNLGGNCLSRFVCKVFREEDDPGTRRLTRKRRESLEI